MVVCEKLFRAFMVLDIDVIKNVISCQELVCYKMQHVSQRHN